jgi:hypothetical protein
LGRAEISARETGLKTLHVISLLEQFAVVLQTGTVQILPFVVLLLQNQKNEHVLQPDSERSDSQANSAHKVEWIDISNTDIPPSEYRYF